MQTELAQPQDHDAREARDIIARCVHCGFCTATCPTYQLLGNELDSPRGRIYLIKQALEGRPVTAATQLHLDRCLTCRSCETTCPSGVQYGRLVDIGRRLVERKVRRPAAEQAIRWSLREGLASPLFGPAMKLGQAVRGFLPGPLRDKVPVPQAAGPWPTTRHQRRVLLLEGCVQPSMRPNINTATARVLDAAGIEVVRVPQAGCCGAVRQHLGDADGALAQMRANVRAWWPWIDPAAAKARGVEAILVNASGCGSMVAEYGHLLARDRSLARQAERVASLVRDPCQLLQGPELERLRKQLSLLPDERLAFHPPCTLQHALKLGGVTESLLTALGADLLPLAEAHLCCGSAGTYSVLQPELAGALRTRKLERLQAGSPDLILSANIGCIAHLQGATRTPVWHWIEWLDKRLRH